MSTMQV